VRVLRLDPDAGPVFVGLEGKQILQVSLGTPLAGEPGDPTESHLRPLVQALEVYLGIRPRPLSRARAAWQVLKDWPVVLDPLTPQVRRILEILRQTVPFGTRITYGELARHAGVHPRVVGRAMARNPVPILIPCHRVVAARGPGGYGPGLHWKRWLWQLEGLRTRPEAGPEARD